MITEAQNFYVYVLFRENGQPFYIGKGRNGRWLQHENDARNGRKGHRFAIIRNMQTYNIEIPKIKLHENLTETTAHNHEIALITAIGRRPYGPLVNLTGGGDGMTDPSPEIRAKKAAAMRGRKYSSETRMKMSMARRGRKNQQNALQNYVAEDIHQRPE